MEPAYLASVDADVIAGNRIFKRCCSCFTEEGQKQILKQHNNLQVRFSLFNERIGYVGVLIAWR